MNLDAWSWIIACLRFLPQFVAIYAANYGVKEKWWVFTDSLLPISVKIEAIVTWSGAGTLILRHLERMGLISLWTWVQSRIILQFFMYFSMVRLRPPCASLVSLSASLMTNTLKPLLEVESILLFPAISLTTFWMMWRSWCSLSDGVIYIW